MTETSDVWFVYVLQCEDGSLYTGIAKDVIARYRLHLAGRGAKYTRNHRPKKIVASVQVTGRSQALKLEARIKKLPKSKKVEFLIKSGSIETDVLTPN